MNTKACMPTQYLKWLLSVICSNAKSVRPSFFLQNTSNVLKNGHFLASPETTTVHQQQSKAIQSRSLKLFVLIFTRGYFKDETAKYLYHVKCSARLSRPQTSFCFKAMRLIALLLLLMRGCVTAASSESSDTSPARSSSKGQQKLDNTTINTSNSWEYLMESLERLKRGAGGGGKSRKEHTCDDSPNKNLCLPKSYSKFELPFTESVNVVEIGIDIIDVLRINDKVSKIIFWKNIYICKSAVDIDGFWEFQLLRL